MSTETRFENGVLIVQRLYDASRDSVFEAWIETSKVREWWGCAQCTSVRSEIEPRVGGKYNHHMTLQGAGEVPGFATLIEFDPPNRLAYESSLPGDPSVNMKVTVDFVETEAGTLVRLQHEGIPDVKVDDDTELRSIIREGWQAAFGKLGKFLNAQEECA